MAKARRTKAQIAADKAAAEAADKEAVEAADQSEVKKTNEPVAQGWRNNAVIKLRVSDAPGVNRRGLYISQFETKIPVRLSTLSVVILLDTQKHTVFAKLLCDRAPGQTRDVLVMDAKHTTHCHENLMAIGLSPEEIQIEVAADYDAIAAYLIQADPVSVVGELLSKFAAKLQAGLQGDTGEPVDVEAATGAIEEDEDEDPVTEEVDHESPFDDAEVEDDAVDSVAGDDESVTEPVAEEEEFEEIELEEEFEEIELEEEVVEEIEMEAEDDVEESAVETDADDDVYDGPLPEADFEANGVASYAIDEQGNYIYYDADDNELELEFEEEDAEYETVEIEEEEEEEEPDGESLPPKDAAELEKYLKSLDVDTLRTYARTTGVSQKLIDKCTKPAQLRQQILAKFNDQ